MLVVLSTRAVIMIMCPLQGNIHINTFLVAEPNPPVNLIITVDGLSLVATWSEPFTLQREELSYVIFITGNGNVIQDDEVNVNKTEYEYVFSEPVGEMDCAQYILFTVFSENEYSRSIANVSEWKNIPTGTAQNTENQYTKYH